MAKSGTLTPIRAEQIAAASRFHSRRDGWKRSDRALRQLKEAFPGWDESSSLLKCVAINAFYATQVLAIREMARHVETVMKQSLDPRARVTRLSELTLNSKRRHFVAFASKLCHVFLNDNSFPIYDSIARKVLKLHLGNAYLENKADNYVAFCQNIDHLRAASGIASSYLEIDRYLWIRGQCDNWNASRPVNAELRSVFENPEPDDRADLEKIVGSE